MTIKLKVKPHNINFFGIGAIILFAWIIFAFNYNNPDFENYRILYDYGVEGVYTRIEIGYIFICRIAKAIGLTFVEFRALIGLVGFLIIKNSLQKYTNNIGLILLSYLLYPFLFEAIQIRMFIVSVVVLFSIRYLEEFSKINIIKFVTCILLAASFQVASIFFLVLLLTYIQDNRKVMIISISISIAELILFNQNFIQLILSSFGFLGENFSLGMRYVTFIDTHRRLMWLYFGLDAVPIIIFHINERRKKDICEVGLDVYEKYRNVLIKCVYVSLTTIPLIEIGSSWGRIFRSMLIIIYSAIVNYPIRSGLSSKNNALRKVYLIVFSIVLFYSHILTGSNDTYTRVFRAMIENNYLHDILFK